MESETSLPEGLELIRPMLKYPNGDYERLITPAELAEATGLAVRTVQKWAQTGCIEAVKPKWSKYWLIPMSEIERVAEELEETMREAHGD